MQAGDLTEHTEQGTLDLRLTALALFHRFHFKAAEDLTRGRSQDIKAVIVFGQFFEQGLHLFAIGFQIIHGGGARTGGTEEQDTLVFVGCQFVLALRIHQIIRRENDDADQDHAADTGQRDMEQLVIASFQFIEDSLDNLFKPAFLAMLAQYPRGQHR